MYNDKGSKKNYFRNKYLTIFLIFIALILAALILWLFRENSIMPDNGHGSDANSDTYSLAVFMENSMEETIQEGTVNNIYLNDISESPDEQAKSNIYFNPEETIEKRLTFDEVVDILRYDANSIALPAGMKSYMEVYPDSTFSAFYHKDGSPLYEQFSFSYREDFAYTGYNPLEKHLQVLASRQELLTCYTLIGDDAMLESTINGHKILIGRKEMGYGPYTPVEDGPSIPTGYYHIFVAQFSLNEVNFEVMADNFSEDEFIDALSSIVENGAAFAAVSEPPQNPKMD